MRKMDSLNSNKVNDWENSRMIGQNKKFAHNTLIPYPDVETAIGGANISPYFKYSFFLLSCFIKP